MTTRVHYVSFVRRRMHTLRRLHASRTHDALCMILIRVCVYTDEGGESNGLEAAKRLTTFESSAFAGAVKTWHALLGHHPSFDQRRTTACELLPILSNPKINVTLWTLPNFNSGNIQSKHSTQHHCNVEHKTTPTGSRTNPAPTPGPLASALASGLRISPKAHVPAIVSLSLPP